MWLDMALPSFVHRGLSPRSRALDSNKEGNMDELGVDPRTSRMLCAWLRRPDGWSYICVVRRWLGVCNVQQARAMFELKVESMEGGLEVAAEKKTMEGTYKHRHWIVLEISGVILVRLFVAWFVAFPSRNITLS